VGLDVLQLCYLNTMGTTEPTHKHTEKVTLATFARTVFETLHRVSPEGLAIAFEKAHIEPAVGLAVAPLVDAKPLVFEDQTYHAFAAKIISETTSGTRPCITPHYHKKGCDFVLFLKPTELNLGVLTPDGKGVEWREPVIVKKGDELQIDEEQVHSWRAVEGSESDFLFYCPNEHLVDHSPEHPDGDRYIVKALQNGIPPHYDVK